VSQNEFFVLFGHVDQFQAQVIHPSYKPTVMDGIKMLDGHYTWIGIRDMGSQIFGSFEVLNHIAIR